MPRAEQQVATAMVLTIPKNKRLKPRPKPSPRRPRDQVQDALIGMTAAMVLGCLAIIIGLYCGKGCGT